MIRTNSNNSDQVITNLSISGNMNLPGVTGGTAAASVLVINNTTGRMESRTVLQLGGSSGSSGISGSSGSSGISGTSGTSGSSGSSGSSGTSGFLSAGSNGSIPYYSSGWILNGTNIINDGTNIGIGTLNPQAILHITGTPRIDSSTGTQPVANSVGGGPVKFMGIDETVYLALPSQWLSIVIDGNSYVIPLFIN